MKKFKYNHSPLTYILLSVVLIATAVGCFFSLTGAINQIEDIKRVAYIVLSVINLFLFVGVFSIILCSKYTVSEKFIKLSLGVFSVKYPLENVTSLTNIIDAKKLLVSLNDDSYFFAVINANEFGEFFHAVKDKNPEVVFDANYLSPDKKG